MNGPPPILSPKQRSYLHGITKKVEILEGSVRSGKTFISILRWIKTIETAPWGADLLMVGKTNDTLKRNIIYPMMDLLGSEMNFIEGKREIRIWGRKIHCVGANDSRAQEKIRGLTVSAAYGDEITLWPEDFFEMLHTRLNLAGARFIGTTNPDAPGHWLKKKFLDRIIPDGLNMLRIKFRLPDNPSLSKEFIEDLKKFHTGLFYKRFVEGLWVLAEGAIYDFFSEEKHVLDFPPGDAEYYIVGGDYGTSNPTAFVLIGVNEKLRPMAWVEKEFYFDSKSTGYQISDHEMVEHYKDFIGSVKPRAIYLDPSAASLKVAMTRAGIMNLHEVDNSILDGIRVVGTMLKNGLYGICADCTQTIQDYGSYVWDEKASENKGEDKPIQKDDHTKDAERYAVYNHFGIGTYDIRKLI